jgi:cellobiose phosphorylase
MNAVELLLDKDYGPLLLWPAYSASDPDIGYLSRYAPGRRENGGLYTHAAAWAVMAEALLGRGQRAYEMYSKFNPILRGMKPGLYQVEPYVTPGNVEGPDSPFYGRGGWTWYTGSAAWLFKVSLEGILGVCATLDGLMVRPCIPKEWPAYRVDRSFRGAVYHIEVQNPMKRNHGIRKVIIDDVPEVLADPVKEFLLPIFPAGSEHHIEVGM